MFFRGILGRFLVALSLGGCALFGERPPNDGTVQPGDKDYIDPGGWPGPLAEKYAGQVVFSTKPIALTDSDDSSIITSYELGSPLYARFFSRESAHNLLPECSAPRAVFRMNVNGEHAAQPNQADPFGNFHIGKPLVEVRFASVLSGDASVPITTRATMGGRRENSDINYDAIAEFNALLVKKLREGVNTVHIVVVLDCRATTGDDPVFAEGTLQILVKPGAMAEHIKQSSPQLDPSPHPENETLVPEILEVMRSKRDAGWDREEILGARVVSKTWTPFRHQDTGVLLAFLVEAAVVTRLRTETSPEGCRVFQLQFGRDAAGGPLHFFAISQGGKTFACSNAPK